MSIHKNTPIKNIGGIIIPPPAPKRLKINSHSWQIKGKDLYPEYDKYGQTFEDAQRRDGTAKEFVRAYNKFYSLIKKTKTKKIIQTRKTVQNKENYNNTLEVVCFVTTLICGIILFVFSTTGDTKTLLPWMCLIGVIGLLSGIGLLICGKDSGPINFVP